MKYDVEGSFVLKTKSGAKNSACDKKPEINTDIYRITSFFGNYYIPYRSRKEPKSKRVQLLMYEDLYETVRLIADETKTSVNDIFAAAVFKLCKEYKELFR